MDEPQPTLAGGPPGGHVTREHLEVVAMGADLGTWVWHVHSDATEQNARYAQMLGHALGAIEPTGAGWAAMVHPDDLARVRPLIEAHFAGRSERIDYEVRMRHAAGHWVWIQSRGRVVQRAVDGAPLVVAGTHLDVTAQKAMQRERDAALDRFESLIANMPVPLVRWRVRAAGWPVIEFASARYWRLFGAVTESEVQQARDADTLFAAHLKDPAEAPALQRQIKAAIVARGPFEYENEYRMNDGSTRWFRTSARFAGQDGDGLLWDGVIADTTDLHVQQAALEVARRDAEAASLAKSQFLAAMSHEVRTPLNGLLGTTRLLLDSRLDAHQREWVELQQEAGEALRVVIGDILDLSKIEAGKLELQPRAFDLAHLVHRSVDIVRSTASEKRLSMSVRIDADGPLWIVADAARLRQILLNLLNNAIKFTPAGRVAVSASLMRGPSDADPRRRLVLEVADTGLGIPAERIGELFQPFTQLHRAQVTGGTGLGLAICRQLVTLMGGEIAVDSTPGRGTRIWFEVPVDEEPLEPLEAASSEPEGQFASLQAAPGVAPAGSGGTLRNGAQPGGTRPGGNAEHVTLRLLVVDDVRTSRAVTRALLVSAGHEVLEARDGAEALELVGRERLDAVVMDARMPVMDGLEATRRIRAQPALRGLPVLGLTASTMYAELQSCIQAGMDDAMSKPFELEELLDRLRILVGRRAQGTP